MTTTPQNDEFDQDKSFICLKMDIEIQQSKIHGALNEF